jgi:hypothetical protein
LSLSLERALLSTWKRSEHSCFIIIADHEHTYGTLGVHSLERFRFIHSNTPWSTSKTPTLITSKIPTPTGNDSHKRYCRKPSYSPWRGPIYNNIGHNSPYQICR